MESYNKALPLHRLEKKCDLRNTYHVCNLKQFHILSLLPCENMFEMVFVVSVI